MREFMKSMEILHTFSFSVRKSSYIERFNQTFEVLMAKEKDNSKRWITDTTMSINIALLK